MHNIGVRHHCPKQAYEQLLRQACECLPKGVKVILLADRGFIYAEAMDFAQEQLSWHARFRLKRDTALKA